MTKKLFSTFGQAHFILMGPPGSGKGTFSLVMQQEHGYHQICLGDILRKHKKDKSDLWKRIEEAGGFVDDDVACKIIHDEVSECVASQRPFIIDGFPRTTNAFEFLTQLFEEKHISSGINFVHFVIDDAACVERISKRLVCSKCSNIFNSTTKQPQREMVCDTCNGALEVRDKDTVESTVKRLAAYRSQTEPLLELAKERFNIVSIDAAAPLENSIATFKGLLQAAE